MAYGTNSLKQMAEEQGVSVIELVRNAVVEAGSVQGAAVRIGCAPSSIRHWLKKAGLRVVTKQVALLEEEERLQ